MMNKKKTAIVPSHSVEGGRVLIILDYYNEFKYITKYFMLDIKILGTKGVIPTNFLMTLGPKREYIALQDPYLVLQTKGPKR